jgi:hypothetical protein
MTASPSAIVLGASMSGLLAARVLGNHFETTIDADLVVDASGRRPQSPRWLEEWGFGHPETIR